MNVIDLFSGMEGWSQAFRDRGHNIFRVEIQERFPAEHRDVMTFRVDDTPWVPDVILASPPCTAFTVMQIGRNWNHDHTPKTDKARLGLMLLDRTIKIIRYYQQLNPDLMFVIENPRGKMRKMPQMQQFDRTTVTYCQYGENRMKPTDLWFGGFHKTFELRPPCKNGAPCHEAPPRGSTNGTQGMDSAESAKVPYNLSRRVCKIAEQVMVEHLDKPLH